AVCNVFAIYSETREPHQSSEFTRHANQFIGSVNLFVTEVRRTGNLLHRFPVPPGPRTGYSEAAQSSTLSANAQAIQQSVLR
ncbi:unnamed protein product, partial [Soboliphyme baturini]|uniref:DOCKER domain-containing protein n=1 Tax=Soboliphyme baturini TaxID=241478 RepID=A0A183JAS9_9BILA